MTGQPFHVGCGLRTVRAQVISELHVPGLWPEPARWARPDLVMFDCPEHGLVDWSDVRYDPRHARPHQAARETRDVTVGTLTRRWERPKQGLFR